MRIIRSLKKKANVVECALSRLIDNRSQYIRVLTSRLQRQCERKLRAFVFVQRMRTSAACLWCGIHRFGSVTTALKLELFLLSFRSKIVRPSFLHLPIFYLFFSKDQ